MNYLIDDYIFDTERLIFYSRFLTDSIVNTINNEFVKEDISRLYYILDNLETSNMSLYGKFPTTGIICPTNNCQLACAYCSNNSSCNNISSLSTQDVLALAKYLSKNQKIKQLKTKKNEQVVIYFSGGGEPTFHWDIFVNMVNTLKQYFITNGVSYSFDITTNGILNNDQRHFISSNFNNVMLSYDGISSLQNFNRPLRGINDSSSIVEESLLFFSHTVPTRVRTTLWPDKINYLTIIADNIYSNFSNIVEWSILPVNNTGRAIENGSQEMYDCNKYNFADAFINICKYVNERYGKDNVVSPTFNNNLVPIYCGSSNVKSLTLMPNKTLVTCMEETSHMPIVGIIDNGTINIFESYTDDLMAVTKEKFTECKHCLAYPFCRGGCPAKFLRDSEYRIHSATWDCQMIINYWTIIFKELLKGNDFMGWTFDRFKINDINHPFVFRLKKL